MNDSEHLCALIPWNKTCWECKDSMFCRGTHTYAATLQCMSHLTSFPGFTLISWEDGTVTSSLTRWRTLVRAFHVWITVTWTDPHFMGCIRGSSLLPGFILLNVTAGWVQSQPDLWCGVYVFSPCLCGFSPGIPVSSTPWNYSLWWRNGLNTEVQFKKWLDLGLQ